MKIEETKFDINSFFAKVTNGKQDNSKSDNLIGGDKKGLTAERIEQMSVEQLEEGLDEIVPLAADGIREKNIEDLQNQLNLIMKIEKKVEVEKSKVANIEVKDINQPPRNSSESLSYNFEHVKITNFCAIIIIAFYLGSSLAVNKSH